MTGEALTKIGGFIPRLEKVYLDDIFTDTNYLSRYTICRCVKLIAKISNLKTLNHFLRMQLSGILLCRIKQTTLQSKWGSSNNDDLLEAWKSLARSIMCCRLEFTLINEKRYQQHKTIGNRALAVVSSKFLLIFIQGC